MREKKKQPMHRLGVRFPAIMVDSLRTLAEHENRSLNGEVTQAVYEYIMRRQKQKGAALSKRGISNILTKMCISALLF